MTVFDNHTVWVKFYNFAEMDSRGQESFYHYTVDGKSHIMLISPETFYKRHPESGKYIYKISFYVHDVFQFTASFFIKENGGIYNDKFFNPTYQLLHGSTMADAEHHVTMMLLSTGEKL